MTNCRLYWTNVDMNFQNVQLDMEYYFLKRSSDEDLFQGDLKRPQINSFLLLCSGNVRFSLRICSLLALCA